MKILTSTVTGYEGTCTPTWLNSDTTCHRLDMGITGFFKLVKKKWWLYWTVGEEFHGIIKEGVVQSMDPTRPHLIDSIDSLDWLRRYNEKNR